jgi:hypothetical protein
MVPFASSQINQSIYPPTFFFYQSNYRILNNFLFLHAQNDNGYVHASLPHGEFIPILQLGP